MLASGHQNICFKIAETKYMVFCPVNLLLRSRKKWDGPLRRNYEKNPGKKKQVVTRVTCFRYFIRITVKCAPTKYFQKR